MIIHSIYPWRGLGAPAIVITLGISEANEQGLKSLWAARKVPSVWDSGLGLKRWPVRQGPSQ